MAGHGRIGELPPHETSPEKGFEAPDPARELHEGAAPGSAEAPRSFAAEEEDERLAKYVRAENPQMMDGQLGDAIDKGGETNPEGSVDISNYEFQVHERRRERPAGETQAPAHGRNLPPRTDD